MKHLWTALGIATALLTSPAAPSLASPPDPAPWSAAIAGLAQRIRHGDSLVVQVVIPLCHSGQIACGDHGLGAPDRPATNLYWGALYGARRFFARPERGWTAIPQRTTPPGRLERAVFRRLGPGRPWGRDAPVEQIVVLDAIDGDAIDRAVDDFFHRATAGAEITIDDGDRRRKLTVAAVGYAGHNRLMDGKRLPAPGRGGEPIPSFVLACDSEPHFAEALRAGGSTPLLTTRALMAPEGYVVEAAARALGDNLPAADLRAAVVRAYARWQRTSERTAGRIFTP